MAGKPVVMNRNVSCAAAGCKATGLRGTDPTGRPSPPVGWFEVELRNTDGKTATILFAHSAACRGAVAAGMVNVLRPMSDKHPELR